MLNSYVGSKMALIIHDNRKFAKRTFYCMMNTGFRAGIMIPANKFKELIAIHISSCYNTSTESIHDRVVASRVYENRRAGIHRKGGGADDSF